MGDFEFLNGAHAALQKEMLAEKDAEQRAYLEKLRAEAWDRVQIASRTRPLCFAMVPGYVWVGLKDSPRCFIDPGLAGLGDAWSILFMWSRARYAMHCSELSDGLSHQALKLRMNKATEWIEGPADCKPLGSLLRRIQISRGGAIAPPGLFPEIQLDV